ncbi:MAG: bifunctional DNA-formamidopyrimidine glycosylase/DNA-(apurinic or apyrimidinic site) lyase [Pseudomonadota bacterium]
MPELPEVETVKRGLAPVLEGAVLRRVVQRRADLRWPLPERFAERLTGRRVARLDRRSKYILVALDPADAAPAETWIIHLGMTGRVLVGPATEVENDAAGAECVCNGADKHTESSAESPAGADDGANLGDTARAEGDAPLEMLGGFIHVAAGDAGHGPHDHVIAETDRAQRLVYNDARRFGAMDLWPTADIAAHPWFARLGPEPLSNAFSGAVLAERLAGKATPIKAALLDQRMVAGLGNIYVCEALHRAGIHPRRIAGTIGRARIERLAVEIRDTLQEAIAAGGSTLRDYRHADGELGYFQHAFRAYGREGEPCRSANCSGKILRIVQSGRSTFYCSRCQR